jgi:hypothetical protein
MMFDAHAYQGQPSLSLPHVAPQGLFNSALTPYQTHGQIFPGGPQLFGQLGGAMGHFGSPMLGPSSFGPYAGFGSPYGPFGAPPNPWTQPFGGLAGPLSAGPFPLGSLQAQCAQAFGAQNPAQHALAFGGLSPLQQSIPFGGMSPLQQSIPFGGMSPLQQSIPFGGMSPLQQSVPFGGLSWPQQLPHPPQHGLPFGAIGSPNPYGHQFQPFGGLPGQPIACLTPQGLVAILPTQSPQLFGTLGFWPGQQQLGRIPPYQLTPQMVSATA